MLWDILVQLAWFYYNEKKGRKLNIINIIYQQNIKKLDHQNINQTKDTYNLWFFIDRKLIHKTKG